MADVLTAESLALSNVLNDPAITIVAHLGVTTIPEDGSPVLLAGITECSFLGYAPIESPGFDVFENADPNSGEAVSDPLRWTAGAVTSPQSANCLYLTLTPTGGSPVLWQFFPLVNPWPFDVPGRSYAVQVRVRSWNNAAVPVDGADFS